MLLFCASRFRALFPIVLYPLTHRLKLSRDTRAFTSQFNSSSVTRLMLKLYRTVAVPRSRSFGSVKQRLFVLYEWIARFAESYLNVSSTTGPAFCKVPYNPIMFSKPYLQLHGSYLQDMELNLYKYHIVQHIPHPDLSRQRF